MNGWSAHKTRAPALKIPGLRLLSAAGGRAGNLPSQMDGRINYSDWIKKVAANTRHSHTAIIIIILGVCVLWGMETSSRARVNAEVTKIEWPTRLSVCFIPRAAAAPPPPPLSPTRPTHLILFYQIHIRSLALVGSCKTRFWLRCEICEARMR